MTFWPVKAARTAATVSRTRVIGRSNGTPIHCCTIVLVEMPSPSTKRPPEMRCKDAAVSAINAGGRVKTAIIAVPRRIRSVATEAAASGTIASLSKVS